MAEQTWTVTKTCACGTVMRVTYTIDVAGLTDGFDCENCYTARHNRAAYPGSFYCSGCAKRHDKRGFHERKAA